MVSSALRKLFCVSNSVFKSFKRIVWKCLISLQYKVNVAKLKYEAVTAAHQEQILKANQPKNTISRETVPFMEAK